MIRKTIKWGGAAVSVLLVVVWIGSAWWFAAVTARTPPIGVSLDRGALTLSHNDKWEWGAGVFLRNGRGFFLWWQAFTWGTNGWTIGIPVWWLIVPSVGTFAFAWRLDTLARRRARLNLCPKCNYDRAGLAKDAVCPECGERPMIA
jgi:hypothetical protein